MKRRHLTLVLPLIAKLIKVHQETSFERQKSQWIRLNTALQNVSVMGSIFHCHSTHQRQLEVWRRWTREKQRAVLEHLRTGAFGASLEHELENWSRECLFHGPRDSGGSMRRASWETRTTLYGWVLQNIVHRKGMSRAEFNQCCMVPVPAPATGRVFYTLHVLSEPRAKSMSWDWCKTKGKGKGGGW